MQRFAEAFTIAIIACRGLSSLSPWYEKQRAWGRGYGGEVIMVFTDKHVEDFPLINFSREEFLVIAFLASRKLNWEIIHISSNGIIALAGEAGEHGRAEIKIKIEKGHAILSSSSNIDKSARNKQNIHDFLSAVEETNPSLTVEHVISVYQQLQPNFVYGKEDLLQTQPLSVSAQLRGLFAIFIPKAGFTITPLLLDLNLFIFIMMGIGGVNMISPDQESLLHWGANFRPLTMEGQWWRLLTCCFLHIGIVHLLLNMYALLFIGYLLEPLLGSLKFIVAYLLSGIMASITSLWWHNLSISAGASGAIFGMYGVYLALLTTNLIEKSERKTLLISIGIFVTYNLLNGLNGAVDNAAHLGGLLSGFIIGYAFVPALKQGKR
ncbi:MAG: rhomboid family intramembrane serine protease [Bacteroidota bacterium]|nr:rhomboid family intramembrane serine protease [Bacteroidota bacterium]